VQEGIDVSNYLSFLASAAVVVVVPGPDFAVVTSNTVRGGRRRGLWASVGVASSNAVQGIAAAAGLGALIVRSEPVFQAVRWAGVGYLLYLGVRALSSARRGRYPAMPDDPPERTGAALTGWRQGFLSNITNPKVLTFYLAVLPQFLTSGSSFATASAFALSHAALSLLYLVLLVTGMVRARRLLARRRVRRALDAGTGVVMIGFSVRLAAEGP
jgi:threonine/homoserine/homoserine lactone efflux protein